MWLKRAVQWAAVGGPLTLVVAIAVNGRYGTPLFDDVSFGPDAHAKLMQYAPLLARAEIMSEDERPSTSEVVEAADRWIALARAGRLKPVLPVEYEDANQDSVLSQVKDAKANILYLLDRAAKGEPSADRSARLRLRALEVSGIAKYSDFASVHEFGTWQAKNLSALRGLEPRLSPATRREVMDCLRHMKPDETGLMSILVNLRALHQRFMERTGSESLPIEIGSGYGLMVAAVSTGPTMGIEQLRASISERKIPGKILGTANTARVAMTAEKRFRTELALTLDRYRSVGNQSVK